MGLCLGDDGVVDVTEGLNKTLKTRNSRRFSVLKKVSIFGIVTVRRRDTFRHRRVEKVSYYVSRVESTVPGHPNRREQNEKGTSPTTLERPETENDLWKLGQRKGHSHKHTTSKWEE